MAVEDELVKLRSENEKLRKVVTYLALYLKHLPICEDESREAEQLKEVGVILPRTAQAVCPVEQVEKLLDEIERG